jgi:hypothetical protein
LQLNFIATEQPQKLADTIDQKPTETPKDEGKKKLKKTKSDISETTEAPKTVDTSVEQSKQPESKDTELETKPMTALEKRKQDQLKFEGTFCYDQLTIIT